MNKYVERQLPPLPTTVGSLQSTDEFIESSGSDDSLEYDENEYEKYSDDQDHKLQFNASGANNKQNINYMNDNDNYECDDDLFNSEANLAPSSKKSPNEESPVNENINDIAAEKQDSIIINNMSQNTSSSPEKNKLALQFSILYELLFIYSSIFLSIYSNSAINSSYELRRRNRQERQTAMEEKIKDIKRKQKETEAAAEAEPKKRRCLMVFSGVVVCVLCCAYVYTKLS